MGMRIPKVPQAVPIEKERNAAIAKTITGRNIALMPELVTMDCMNCGVLKSSRHTPERVQARIRMMLAGNMIFMPSTLPLKKSAKERSRRGTKRSSATTMAPKEAHTSDIEAEELPIAAIKVWYFASSPQ